MQVVVGDDDALDQVVVDLVLLGLHVVGDLALGAPCRRCRSRRCRSAGRRCRGTRPPRRWAARAGRCRRRSTSRSWSSVRLERGPLPVELVDEDHAGQAQLGGPPPHDLVLDLDALDGADDEHGQVGDLQGGPDVAHEVGVAGGVDQVDLEAVPLERGEGERQRDAPLVLGGVVVADGVAVLDPALAGDRPRPGAAGPRPGSSSRRRRARPGPRCGSCRPIRSSRAPPCCGPLAGPRTIDPTAGSRSHAERQRVA